MLLPHNVLPSRRKLSAIIAFALVLILINSLHTNNGGSTLGFISSGGSYKANRFLQDQRKFWKQFYSDIILHGPKTTALQHPEDTKLDIFFDSSGDRERPDLLRITASQLSALRESQADFRQAILQSKRTYQIPYRPGLRGIVTTAGGPYLVVALVSIRLLRETKSTLPVEVWLATWDEFDKDICGKILPKLNAECKVLESIFDVAEDTSTKPGSEANKYSKIKTLGITKYQYKSLAILFSSFEQLLFLDSDCFPIYDPAPLFTSIPFESTGFILWPDFWAPSESPYFFDISGIPPSQIPSINSRPSTESGQMMFDKSKHAESIMLAMYYNYYGPDYYYPLQSQGAPGEGDKETFLWSAVALNRPLYTVKTSVRALGFTAKNGEWRGSAMAQSNPIEDFDLHTGSSDLAVTDVEKLKHSSSSTDPSDKASQEAKQASTFFIHANFPKLDPSQIFEASSFGAKGPTRDSDGKFRRIWHQDSSTTERIYGFDLERRVWSVVKDLACGEFGKSHWSWRNVKQFGKTACQQAEGYWKTVFEEHS